MSAAPRATLYYSHNLNPRVAVAVARHLQAPLDFVRADPRGRDGDWFGALNPNTLVPVLVEPDGRGLWETDAIALRLSRRYSPGFWPAGEPGEEVQQWVSWSAHHFTRAGGVLYFERIIVPRHLPRAPDTAAIAAAEADFAGLAALLDAHLDGRDWLVGAQPTYADFRVASALPFADEAGLPLAACPRVRDWHARLWALPAWREPFAGLGDA